LKTVSKTLLKIAVLCIGIQDISAGAATPALGVIIQAFPAINPSIVMMIATIPSLCMVLFSPIYAKLTEVMKKKTILRIAIVLFMIGGGAPTFLNNLYLILASRFVFGIAIGFVFPMVLDLVVDLFEGREQQTMLGLIGTVASIGGILFQTIGGALANIDWHYCFLAYLMSFVFFGFSLIFLPEPGIKQRQVRDGVKQKIKMTAGAWLYCVMYGLWELFFYVLVTNTSIVVISENLGSPASVGVSLSLLTLASIVTATLYGKISAVIKRSTATVSYLVTLAGFVVFYLGRDLTMITVGIIVVGLGMGCTLPAIITRATSLVPKESSTFAVSMVSTFLGIGAFCETFVMDFICQLAHQPPGRFPFLVAIIGLAVTTGALAILIAATKKKESITPIQA
jgi:predicted MFS family arabinose efflux permease